MFVGFALLWLGYTAGWMGIMTIQGNAVGIKDLILPSHVNQFEGKVAHTVPACAGAPGQMNTPDLPPGSIANNPDQGLPPALAPLPNQPGQITLNPVSTILNPLG